MKNNKVLEKGRNHSSESGAIMLEVIAVLSLMALMGAALFRQIYLRNQELSNVQMASEIRVVKEAFASWIQAHPELKSNADYDGIWHRVGTTTDLTGMDDLTEIASYLPLAYDELLCKYTTNAAGDDVCFNPINYALFGRCDPLGPDDGYTRCIGLVVPYADTLPEDADWNFRRAAHVAMLIGADGGVFGKGMTNNKPLDTSDPGDYIIVGSLGSWTETLDADTSDLHPMTTYAATTGMDVFQPEIELPPVPVGLDKAARLVLDRVHVYGAFTAGDETGCYTNIQHNESERIADAYIIKNDDDLVDQPNNAACWPAFYVESGEYDSTDGALEGRAKGNVRVANDLSVGYEYDTKKSAMRFDKNGMIVFEKAPVSDPQTGNDINYVLDPQYTSVMNDIKIMSRGGAKLSEILPNYILKTQELLQMNPSAYNSLSEVGATSDNTHNYTVNLPNCPVGYKKAMILIPISFGANAGLQLNAADVTGTISGTVTIDPTTGSGTISGGTVTLNSSAFNRYRVYFKLDKNANAIESSSAYWKKKYEKIVQGRSGPFDSSTGEGWNFINVNVGYFNPGTPSSSGDRITNLPELDEEILAIAQTYCVFDPTDMAVDGSSKSQKRINCQDMGGSWDETNEKCSITLPEKSRPSSEADCTKLKTQGTCELMGCTWDSSGSGSCGSSSTP